MASDERTGCFRTHTYTHIPEYSSIYSLSSFSEESFIYHRQTVILLVHSYLVYMRTKPGTRITESPRNHHYREVCIVGFPLAIQQRTIHRLFRPLFVHPRKW